MSTEALSHYDFVQTWGAVDHQKGAVTLRPCSQHAYDTGPMASQRRFAREQNCDRANCAIGPRG